MPPFSFKQFDMTAHPRQNLLPRLIAVAQITAQAAFNTMAKNFRYQIGNFIGRIFYFATSIRWKLTIQIGGIKHQ